MTKTLNELEKKWMKNLKIRAEYEALAEGFAIAETLISARVEADMTQEEVAEKMQTSQSYIAKLEGGIVNPSMKALQRYAKATGSQLKIRLEQPRA